MGLHRISMPGIGLAEGEPIGVEGEEAHHARRVRRLDVGDAVEVLDGEGGIAACRVARCEKLGKRGGWRLVIVPERVRRVEPISPRVEVYSEPPKGHDLERMIDQLSQLGVARWSPLACERSEVDPRPAKLERLSRIASEASKQCGRAWSMMIGERVGFDEALRAEPGEHVIVCHMSGEPFRAGQSNRLRLLIGPVGDLSGAEIDAAREAGATIATFGPLTMRVDTACAAASAVVMANPRPQA